MVEVCSNSAKPNGNRSDIAKRSSVSDPDRPILADRASFARKIRPPHDSPLPIGPIHPCRCSRTEAVFDGKSVPPTTPQFPLDPYSLDAQLHRRLTVPDCTLSAFRPAACAEVCSNSVKLQRKRLWHCHKVVVVRPRAPYARGSRLFRRQNPSRQRPLNCH
jgi:hypothetical protein